MNEKVIEITLPGTDILVKIILQRHGQEKPEFSDKVVVCGEIRILTGKYASIPKTIQFKHRVSLLGDSLNETWGGNGVEKDGTTCHRGILDYFSSYKWSEAFETAEDTLRTEVQKLIDALTTRQKALLDAELED